MNRLVLTLFFLLASLCTSCRGERSGPESIAVTEAPLVARSDERGRHEDDHKPEPRRGFHLVEATIADIHAAFARRELDC